jgi:hypothetical protein
MIRRSLVTAIAATAVVLSGTAQAAIIAFDFSNPLELTELRQVGNLGLFDPSLGVLNSVVLTLSARNTTSLSLTNTAAQDQEVRASVSTDLFFTSSLAGLDALLVNPVISLDNATGFVTIPSGSTASFGPLVDAMMVAPLVPASLFVGVGDFSVTCVSQSGIAISGGGGNVAADQSTMAACGATIAYDYTPGQPPLRTPEPGVLALLGACVVGTVAARTRVGKTA